MKPQTLWSIIIPILLGLSLYVIFSTHDGVRNYPPKFGLDIKGGVRVTLQADTSKAPNGQFTADDATAVIRILENRINGSGVGEATVQQKGDSQFVVELPDVTQDDQIVANLGKMAQMTMYYFRDVRSPQFPNNPIEMSETTDPTTHEENVIFTDDRTHQTFRDEAHIRQDYTTVLALGVTSRPGATQFTVTAPLSEDPKGTQYYLTPDQQNQVLNLNRELTAWQQFLQDSPVIMTGIDILPQSIAQIDPNSGSQPVVTQEFSPDGTTKMANFTLAHVNEFMGIVLDDKILSAPRIDSPITEGHGEISGGFATLKEAQQLANMLNAGALPVPLEQVQVESVQSTLGAGTVHKSEMAGIAGLILVLLFMLVYYRLPGLVADVALCIYTVFTLAIYRGALDKLFPGFVVVLTLPGIAGFILSIGMAVDANILIFERMKEELRNGKTLKSAIDAGFKRAFTAIRDSNICTIITSVVLWSLGTPEVKGFAITLLIGVLVSLFSAITVTRTLLYWLVNAGIAVNPALFGLNVRSASLTHTDTATGSEVGGWNIIGLRKFFYGLSLAIIVPGMFFLLGLHGLKKSFEFTGGTQIEVSYPTAVSQDAVQNALRTDFPDAIVQMANGGNMAIVSTQRTSDQPDKLQNEVYLGLMGDLDKIGPANEQSFGIVKGVIAAELTQKAIQAVLLASSLIVLYLAFAFSIGGFAAGLRFGTSAIIALLHDVLVLVGVFAILGYFLGWKIDSLFVTALLTVIGFSVHDTVVIFDRVRENLARSTKGELFEDLVNKSIQQSLARSINTSLTVLMTLAMLILFGGQSTLQLNVALFIGILSGTYSSIFNASAILVDWENWLARRRAAASGGSSSGGKGSMAVASAGAASTTTQVVRPESRPSDTFRRPDSSEPSTGVSRGKKKKPARRF